MLHNDAALTYRSRGLTTIKSLEKVNDVKNTISKASCEFLDLTDNSFTGLDQAFQGLLSYTSLQSLSLQNNCLRGNWSTLLIKNVSLTTLRKLDISNNNIIHIPWQDLSQFPLLDLSINNNSITTLNIPASISTLPLSQSLRSFSISNNQLFNLNGIELFPNLDALDVRVNKICQSEEHLKSLSCLNKLQTLKIDGNPCTSGEFCVPNQGCWRGVVMLCHCPKVVLLDGVRVSPNYENRRVWVNKTICKCGLEWQKSGVRGNVQVIITPSVTIEEEAPETSVVVEMEEEEEEEAEEEEEEEEEIEPTPILAKIEATSQAQVVAQVVAQIKKPRRPILLLSSPVQKQKSPLVTSRRHHVPMLKQSVQVVPFGERRATQPIANFRAMPFRKLGEHRTAKAIKLNRNGNWSTKGNNNGRKNVDNNWLTEMLDAKRKKRAVRR